MGEVECVLGQGGCPLQERAWSFGGSGKPAGTGFVFLVVNSLCGATLGHIFCSECPSKKLKEGGKGPKIALSRLNFASFWSYKVI